MKTLLAALAFGLSMAASTASAQEASPPPQTPSAPQQATPDPLSVDTDGDADMRCLLVSFMLAQSATDPATRQALTAAGLYYLGRIDGRSPNYDFSAHAIEAARHLSAEMVATERVRCGSYMTNRGRVLVQLGQDLVARAQQESQTHRQEP